MILRSDITTTDGTTPEGGVFVKVKDANGVPAPIYDSAGAILSNPFQTGGDGGFSYNVGAEGSYIEEFRLTAAGVPRTSVHVRIAAAQAPSLPAGDIALPTQFNNQLNVQVYFDGTKVQCRENPYDLIDFTLTDTGVTHYYVSYAGADSGAGTTAGAPWKTVIYALAHAATPAVIHLLDGYVGINGWSSNPKTFSGKVKIIGKSPTSRTIFWPRRESETVSSFAWAASGGAYVSTATAARYYRAQFDANFRDGKGIPRPITSAASAAVCQATAGTFFWDGVSSLYVHMWDGRIPDPDNGWLYAEATRNFEIQQVLSTSAGVILLEDLEFFSNTGTAVLSSCRYRPVTTGAVNSTRFGRRNCLSYGADGNLFETYDPGIGCFDKCIAAFGHSDGHNYHSFVTTGTKGAFNTIYETDCEAYHVGYNGWADQVAPGTSSNATTAHDSINILRVNPVGADCNGAVLADVNGVLSVNLNPVMGHPGATASPKALYWHDNYLGAGTSNGMYIWGGRGHNDGDGTVNLLDNTAQGGGATGQIYLKYWRGQTSGTVVGTLKDWSGATLASLAAAV